MSDAFHIFLSKICFSFWYLFLPLSLFSLIFIFPFLLLSLSFSFNQWSFNGQHSLNQKFNTTAQ